MQGFVYGADQNQGSETEGSNAAACNTPSRAELPPDVRSQLRDHAGGFAVFCHRFFGTVLCPRLRFAARTVSTDCRYIIYEPHTHSSFLFSHYSNRVLGACCEPACEHDAFVRVSVQPHYRGHTILFLAGNSLFRQKKQQYEGKQTRSIVAFLSRTQTVR